MAVNQILQFGGAAGANVLTPAAYAALASRQTGFQSGVAKSVDVNTVLRQAAFVSAMLGQFTSDRSGQDVLDDGDIPGLQTKFEAALTAALPTANSSRAGIVQLATAAEVQAGTNTGRAVTPAGLQSKVQSTVTDATAGRLMAVGAFGLGALQSPPWPGNDLTANPSTIPSGTYIATSSGTGLPASGAWVISWDRYSSSVGVMTAVSVGADGGVYRKVWSSSAWTSWTPDVLLSDFTGTNQSLAANGFQKLPGGLILQWGLSSSVSGSASTFIFPIAFPNAMLIRGAFSNDTGSIGIFSTVSTSGDTKVNMAVSAWTSTSSRAPSGYTSWCFALGY